MVNLQEWDYWDGLNVARADAEKKKENAFNKVAILNAQRPKDPISKGIHEWRLRRARAAEEKAFDLETALTTNVRNVTISRGEIVYLTNSGNLTTWFAGNVIPVGDQPAYKGHIADLTHNYGPAFKAINRAAKRVARQRERQQGPRR